MPSPGKIEIEMKKPGLDCRAFPFLKVNSFRINHEDIKSMK